ncbi:MAG: helix-turn-helix transcriptional regulator [Vulcanibacillus sp.]
MGNESLTTREEILLMIKKKGILSASEISKDIGITEMAVRRHLNTLERDELIESSLIRQTMGRPTNNYSLTERADDFYPKTYKSFAQDILNLIIEMDGREKLTEIFNIGKERFIETYQKKMFAIINMEDRINALINIQNQKGYMAELEVTEDEYIIKKYNCPISAIAMEFNQVCEIEKELYNNILETEVKCTQCLSNGDKYCVFRVKKF